MKNKIFIGGLVFAAMLVLPTLAWSDPGVEISPSEHDFGEVELGSTSTTFITITNAGFESISLFDVSLLPGSSSDFSITLAPPPGTMIIYPESVEVEVTYTPSALGYTSATLVIDWTNGESGTEFVDLSGIGVDSPGGVTVEDILAFFDQSVIEGKLVGKGRGRAALARLFVFRKSIKTAGKFIERGRSRAACGLLWVTYKRCDGIRIPPDFVRGDATPELNVMILELISTLGCL